MFVIKIEGANYGCFYVFFLFYETYETKRNISQEIQHTSRDASNKSTKLSSRWRWLSFSQYINIFKCCLFLIYLWSIYLTNLLIMIIGRSTDIVDGNLNILKERIEIVKVKERFERCCRCQHGWNYVPLSINDHKRNKRDKELRNFIELIGLICGTIGFTSFVGTLFLCLVSLIVHLQVWLISSLRNGFWRCLHGRYIWTFYVNFI